MEANIKSIAIGRVKEYRFNEKRFESAYKKDTFVESIDVNILGLVGDAQADERFHGGPDKAIHIGSIKHLEDNSDFDLLSMGCNILIDSFDEDDICIADVYSIGEVIVEVTQPRQPCWKIGALFGKDVNRYITRNHATGWYVRVIKEGAINENDKMVLKKRVSNLTIKNLSEYLKMPPSDKRIIDEILNLEALAQSYRGDFIFSLDKNNS